MSHIRNVGLQRISYSNKTGACQAQTLQQKPSQFHQKAGPVLGSKKRAPFGGPFSMLTLRAIPFPIWNPKKVSIFPAQNWGFFLLFFVVAVALVQWRPMKAAWFCALLFDPRFGGQNCLSCGGSLERGWKLQVQRRSNLSRERLPPAAR